MLKTYHIFETYAYFYFHIFSGIVHEPNVSSEKEREPRINTHSCHRTGRENRPLDGGPDGVHLFLCHLAGGPGWDRSQGVIVEVIHGDSDGCFAPQTIYPWWRTGTVDLAASIPAGIMFTLQGVNPPWSKDVCTNSGLRNEGAIACLPCTCGSARGNELMLHAVWNNSL